MLVFYDTIYMLMIYVYDTIYMLMIYETIVS